MSSCIKAPLKILFLSSALSGCGSHISEYIHARDGELPEISDEWPVGTSGRHFIEAKLLSHEEVYIGWRMSFQPETH